MKLTITFAKGSPSSGHYGHSGRPGKVGGSTPGTGLVLRLSATKTIPSLYGSGTINVIDEDKYDNLWEEGRKTGKKHFGSTFIQGDRDPDQQVVLVNTIDELASEIGVELDDPFFLDDFEFYMLYDLNTKKGMIHPLYKTFDVDMSARNVKDWYTNDAKDNEIIFSVYTEGDFSSIMAVIP